MDLNNGKLSCVVWPLYIGAAMQGMTPPFSCDEPHNGGYRRGQIIWEPVPDERQMVGRARVILPPGVYSHWVYFLSEFRPQACGVQQMNFPLHLPELTTVDVYPIFNHDLALSQGGNIR